MKKYFILLLVSISLMSFSLDNENVRKRIDLKGSWAFRLDSLNKGVKENWQTVDFVDRVFLPGTTDTNRKGILNTKTDETTHLSRIYSYTGKAWYKRQVNIPRDWNGREVYLFLERTKPTVVWVDGKEIGSNDNISTSQVYNLTPYISSGIHVITVLVDNGESVPPQLLTNSHAYTESTQTNWNGIIGEMYLEAVDRFHIRDVQVYPDAKNKSVSVKVSLSNPENIKDAVIRIDAESWNSETIHQVKSIDYKIGTSEEELILEYPMGNEALLWSEFHPSLYKMNVILTGKKRYDSQCINFGLRDFKARGTQFRVNDHITFLRGKHDACVFPLTAHVAMDIESWRNYFRIAKQYGINHYRFHSWCPPKACFEAADIEGIYLQPELPFWGTFKKEDTRLISFLKKEGINIQKEYGNSASFVMFALGNEIFGDQEVMDTLVSVFRKIDNRHLYAFGANNYLGYNGQVAGEDFLVTCRIGGAPENSFETHTRASFSFADAYDGGYINHTYPNSSMDFSGAIKNTTIPVIGHETGQFQIYPDYNEINKYKGVLEPRNFEVFKQRLTDAGMLDQANDFFKASGKLAAILYRADIEMNLRTPGLGGFQLLDLQDYPGQGSAFVGILDAFMDSKGLISSEEWRNFCSPVVPLFVTDKFCWTNSEVLEGSIKIANYSEDRLSDKKLQWSLSDTQGRVIKRDTIDIKGDTFGLVDLGQIKCDLLSISNSQKVWLNIEIPGTNYKNVYPLWVYPTEKSIVKADNIIVTDILDDTIRLKLERGEKVLWFPNRGDYSKSTISGLFQTDYWNFRMFKTICENNKKPVSPGTLGILTNPNHPIFKDFPTDYHSDWQWFSIIKNSYPLIMDDMPANYRPIVQVIDNVERNHKLGLIFEFEIGEGRLLVCMSDLQKAMDKPEVKQLYKSIIYYMKSKDFRPVTKIKITDLDSLFSQTGSNRSIQLLENISYQ